MNHLLIDADILLFKASAHSEKPIEWTEGFWTMHGFEDDALLYFNNRLTEWKDRFETEKVTLCLTDTENWRKKVLPSYKAHRKATRKPLILPVVRQKLIDNYDAVIWDTLWMAQKLFELILYYYGQKTDGSKIHPVGLVN